jgi:hypothetical protein
VSTLADSFVRASDAERLAGAILEPSGARWSRTQAVVRLVASLAHTVELRDREVLLAAAWLHDIGSEPALHDSGFAPLDGARHLEQLGWSLRLCGLVAHHTGDRPLFHAHWLDAELDTYPFEVSPVSDALTYADRQVESPGLPPELRSPFTIGAHHLATSASFSSVRPVLQPVDPAWAAHLQDIDDRVDRRIEVCG